MFSMFCIHCSLISGWSDSNSIRNPISSDSDAWINYYNFLQIQVFLHLLKKKYSTISNFKRSLRSIIGNWTFALNIFLTIKHPTATRIITMLKFIAIIHDKSIWPLKKLQFVAIFSCSIVKVRIFKQKSPWKSLSICNYFCKWTNQHSLILVKPTKYERRLKYCCIVIKLMYSNK